MKCETEMRDLLGNRRERAADDFRCSTIPFNFIQGKMVQKRCVCGKGCQWCLWLDPCVAVNLNGMCVGGALCVTEGGI